MFQEFVLAEYRVAAQVHRGCAPNQSNRRFFEANFETIATSFLVFRVPVDQLPDLRWRILAATNKKEPISRLAPVPCTEPIELSIGTCFRELTLVRGRRIIDLR